MATCKEIERYKKDAEGARRLCRRILTAAPDALSASGEAILDGIASKTFLNELSTRQAEVILEIRDETELVSTTWNGLSVTRLIRQCYEGRCDLSEADQEWIEKVYDTSRSTIRRRSVGRLVRCARELDYDACQ